MNYWIEPPSLMTLLCAFAMLQLSLFRAMHIHGTDPAGKHCKRTPTELYDASYNIYPQQPHAGRDI